MPKASTARVQLWRHQGGLRPAARGQRERCTIAIVPWHRVAELAEFQRHTTLRRRGCQTQEWMPIGPSHRPTGEPVFRRNQLILEPASGQRTGGHRARLHAKVGHDRRSILATAAQRIVRGAGLRPWRRTSFVAQDFVRGAGHRSWRRTSFVVQDFSPAIPLPPRPCGWSCCLLWALRRSRERGVFLFGRDLAVWL